MLVLALTSLLAAAPAAPRAVMTQGLGSVSTLAPWLSSPTAFRDPKNRPAISRSLQVLAHLQHPFFREPGCGDAATDGGSDGVGAKGRSGGGETSSSIVSAAPSAR